MPTVTVTYLEMLSPDALRPKRSGDFLFIVKEATDRQWQVNRSFYLTVGGAWSWTDKRGWSDEQWEAYVGADRLRTFIAYHDGTPAGYYELHESEDPEAGIEISIFGLVPAFHGRGLGGPLLTSALEEAWKSNPQRVWMHTCSNDHHAALSNYLARGLTIYKTDSQEI